MIDTGTHWHARRLHMLIYNVFGRHIGVQRKNERWLVFRADLTERKFSRLYDIAIPDDMT